VPRVNEIHVAIPTILFTFAVACITALATGIAPAIQLRRMRAGHVLRNGMRATSRETMRMREWLNGAEVALTLVLLVCAALLLSTFVRLRGLDLGFRTGNVMSASIRTPMGRFTEPRPWARYAEHYESIMASLKHTAGIDKVAGVTSVPLTGDSFDGSLWRTDAPGAQGRRPPTSASDQWKAQLLVVTPHYFDVMSIPLHRGRDFDATDAFTAEQMTNPEVEKPVGVAIINAAAARRFWPGENPLGKQIFLFDDQAFAASRTIIAVTGDVRTTDVSQPATPAVYLPFAQHPGPKLSIVAATKLPPARFEQVITNGIHQFDPQLSISRIAPMRDVVSGAVSRPRFNAMLVGAFALIALTLSATGIFGVMAYLVALRTNEIGIRIALGAKRTGVLSLVLATGLRSVVGGLAAGTLIAVVAATAMRGLLFGLAPLDGPSFLIAQAVLLATCLVAAAVPALKAANLDPVVALRDP
jgi:predicted permease